MQFPTVWIRKMGANGATGCRSIARTFGAPSKNTKGRVTSRYPQVLKVKQIYLNVKYLFQNSYQNIPAFIIVGSKNPPFFGCLKV